MTEPARRRPSWKMLHRLGMIHHEQAEARLVNPDQIMYAVRIDGPLDLDRLAHAWDLVQRRHPVLGSSFDLAREHWRIEEPVTGALAVSRLSPQARTEQAATEELATVMRAPFDLTRGPLARLHAVPIDQTLTLVGLAADHLVCDAWSAQILFVELWHLYLTPGMELPPVRTTFPDLVAREQEWLASPAGVAATETRAKALNGVGAQPTALLPGMRAGTADYAQVHRSRFTLPAAQFARLREAHPIRGLAPTALAHAALAGSLHLLTGAERAGTILAVANRADRRLHRTQGWLADNVVVVTQSRDPREPAFLGGFEAAVADALDRTDVPLTALLAWMAPEQFGLPTPHPTAAFNPGASLDQRFLLPQLPGLTLTEIAISDGWGYRTIVVHAAVAATGLEVRVSVKDRWFEQATAELLGAQMEELLTGWAAGR